MKDLFLPILDDDEIVEKTYKPNKLKMFFSTMLASILILCVFCGGMALGMFVPEEGYEPLAPIYALIPVGAFVLVELIVIWFLNLCYKKTVYAITNKRVIIRTGIIGVDYKSLDMAMIGAIDVYVSFIDKILEKNTGTIRFGSTSSPMNAQNGSYYVFKHVVDPYKNCKEIKARIDAYKTEKSKA